MPADPYTVRRLADGCMPPEVAAQVDAIFFEASGRTFGSPEEAAPIRERWLGRYLRGGSDIVLVAQDASGVVAGYLVGALEDPAGERVVLVTSDFQGVPREFSDRVFERLKKEHKLERRQVMLTFSHNHCGPRWVTT